MKVIYKYDVSGDGDTLLPGGAQPLTVQWQSSHDRQGLVCWAIVEEGAVADTPRRLRVVMTGQPAPLLGVGAYLGTVQAPYGLVFHIFDHGWAQE